MVVAPIPNKCENAINHNVNETKMEIDGDSHNTQMIRVILSIDLLDLHMHWKFSTD